MSPSLPQDDENIKLIKALVANFENASKTGINTFLNPEEFLKISEYYSQNNYPKKANEVISYALTLYPYNSHLLFQKATLLEQAESFDEAINMLEKLCLIDPGNQDAIILLSQIYLQVEETEKALDILENAAFAGDHNNEQFYITRANILVKQKKYEESIKNLKKALVINFSNTSALIDLLLCYQELNEPDSAINFYEKFLDKDPYSVEIWNNIGFIYSFIELHEKAIEAFEISLAINPDFPRTHYMIGNSYIETEQYDKAIEAFTEYLKVEKEDSLICFQLGLSYAMKEEYAEAKNFFNKSLDEDPGFSESWYGLGIIYQNQQKPDKAILCFKKALKIHPANEKYWHELGNSYASKANYKYAAKSFEKALQINSSLPDIWIDYALYLYDSGKKTESAGIMEKALKVIPQSPELFYILAGILFDSGHNKKAEYYLEKALQINPVMKDILFDNFPFLYSNSRIMSLIKNYE
jgi:tetratricopeptide (TPR) repeat protein